MSPIAGSGQRSATSLRVLTPTGEPAEIAEWAGGKGKNLHSLTAAGFRVPEWSVIGLDVFTEFARRSGLDTRLAALLAEAPRHGERRTSAEIASLIAAAPLDEDVTEAVRRAYEQVGGGLVAVRSSGADEDGAEHSFAGQFDSFLNVSGFDEVVAHVRRCWASAFSERSLH
ncbi:PEP/pyruvate-binding domain-containing protein, partial [Streptomyces sp. NPDC059466]